MIMTAWLNGCLYISECAGLHVQVYSYFFNVPKNKQVDLIRTNGVEGKSRSCWNLIPFH